MFLPIVLLSLLFTSPLVSQNNVLDQNVRFDYLTVSDGISDLTVRSIIQDHVGYMWFGTNNGLNRYDGKEIIKYYSDRHNPSSLKGNIIYYLYEDSRKNLWIGTWGGGLSLYERDKDNFKTFMHNPNDPGSIRHNDVWNIFEDSRGDLWIATQKGLERFDYETFTFEKHLSDLYLPGESVNLKRKAFSCITEGKDGTLWISVWKHGVLNYDPERKKLIRHLVHESGNSNSLSTSEINTLFVDQDGSLWIGPYKGVLEKMIIVDGSPVFERYPMGPAPQGISDDRINFIVEDQSGMLWIGTENGLNVLNRNTGQIDQYFHNADIDNSLSSNHLWSGYCSINGIMWIGSLDGGVNIFDPWKRKFASNYPAINSAKEQPKRFVKSIYKEQNGSLWVGTDSGLNKFSPNGVLLETYVHGNTPESLNIGGVSGLEKDQEETLWIGTWGGGLHRLNTGTKKLKRYTHPTNKEIPTGIDDLNIQTMVQDFSGKILIGTSFGYLYKFDPATDSFRQFLCNDLDSLRGTPVTAISPDRDGTVWIGLSENGGVIHLDWDKNKATRYYIKVGDNQYSLSSNDIFSLFDDDEYLWIGTKNGLNHLNKKTGKVTVYDERHGLANKSVLSIQKDIEGNVWFSTLQGISKLDRQSGSVFNYDSRDGALANCIVSIKGYNSELYFGGINGIFSFNPLSIYNNSFLPPVVFTSLKIFNHPVTPGDDNSPLLKHINQTEKIVLNYNQTSFSLEFSALNYTLPEKNKFRYKLEGFDQDWVYAGTRNVAYYTNVGQGSYTFKVQGSNNDGLWNPEVRSIEIVILPPWWNTYWFKTLILLSIMAVVGAWIVIRTYRYKQHQRILKRMVEERTREIEEQKVILKEQAHKLQIAGQLKIKFFTNISHEFRTPLTLILNPINKLLAELESRDEYKIPFTVVKRNTLRLISLINQFLDISKIEAGALKLKVARGNICEFIQGIASAYEFATRQKNIKYGVHLPHEKPMCYFDGDKLEKILYNLLSNALKFTPSGKQIDINVQFIHVPVATNIMIENGKRNSDLANYIVIKVKDTGKGIPSNKLDKIFERFYQVEGDEMHPAGGTGIGLSLTKDLVEIYRGRISVKSKLNEGTEFTILLPTDRSLFKEHEIDDMPPVHDELKSGLIAIDEDHLDIESSIDAKINSSENCAKKTIIIVDDNRDVRMYLSGVLSVKYNIVLAKNGVDGFEKAVKYLPQLIVSDVMMPEMDGYAFCEKIKNDVLTCHIPVILLTAKATNDDKVTGYEFGADVYISKPFDVDVLKAVIAQQLETREKLKDIFRRELILQPSDVSVVSSDEKLLNRIIKILDEKLSDSEFGVEELGREVGLSRTHLYRKIKELTSLTAIEFIRNMRLKRAANLLKQNKLYVSEVAYMCGFNELSYFRKIFKELFGVSPQKYASLEQPEIDDVDDDANLTKTSQI
jgi:signal transduction histidine kinase/ligand-binding sensor domain-containing protein/DNA-binding response OmpR family regulator